jgi:acetyl-CoA acetyltransferase
MTSVPAFRGRTAVVGVGATSMQRRGTALSTRALAIEAIVAACASCGVSPRDVDGFASYGHDESSGARLMGALGTRELSWSSMVWDGGGGGLAGAIGAASAAIIAGQASTVAVYRALAEQDGGRRRESVSYGHFGLQYLANGIGSPAQICALRTQRLLSLGLHPDALFGIARASYFHARTNPTSYAKDIVFDEEVYRSSRWVTEPFRLYDCSRENDGAAALILTSAERATDLTEHPAYVLSARQGAHAGWGEREESCEPYHLAGFAAVARRLWEEAECGPNDVDVAQVYENFTGPAVAALIDHGFCTIEDAHELLRLENVTAPGGGLPLNTSGGNIAEGFIHGISLAVEAVRQIRGESLNQVPGATRSLLIGGPAAPLVSSALFGSAAAL